MKNMLFVLKLWYMWIYVMVSVILITMELSSIRLNKYNQQWNHTTWRYKIIWTLPKDTSFLFAYSMFPHPYIHSFPFPSIFCFFAYLLVCFLSFLQNHIKRIMQYVALTNPFGLYTHITFCLSIIQFIFIWIVYSLGY